MLFRGRSTAVRISMSTRQIERKRISREKVFSASFFSRKEKGVVAREEEHCKVMRTRLDKPIFRSPGKLEVRKKS